MTAGHGVSADQFEPTIALEDQAFYHDLSFVLVNWELALAYALTPWMTLETRLPLRMAHVDATFLNEAGAVLPDFESIHHRDETLVGLGDITFGARFSLLPPSLVEGLVVLVSAGLSAPSGSIRPNPFVRGRSGQIHQHIFFGTGTIDPYAAVAVSYDLDWLRLIGFFHARGSLYANRYGYQGTGNLYGGLDVGTDFGLDVFNTSVGVHVLHEVPATWGDENAENSGRSDLLLSLGVSWQVCDGWHLRTGFKVPVWSEAVGGQLDIPIIWDLGVRFVTGLED